MSSSNNCLTGSNALKACTIPLDGVIQLMKDEPDMTISRPRRRAMIRHLENKAKKQKKWLNS